MAERERSLLCCTATCISCKKGVNDSGHITHVFKHLTSCAGEDEELKKWREELIFIFCNQNLCSGREDRAHREASGHLIRIYTNSSITEII